MKKLTQVVIVGYPNVGKSTLFNRLLRRRKALVHSLPGMTRDSVSALCPLDGKRFLLTDTGGLADSTPEPLAAVIKEKAWSEAKKSDLLLLVLDGKRELLPGEEDLFLSLRKLNKPILLVLNKIDSEVQEGKVGDFYNRLKVEKIFPISAEHKRNLDALEEEIVQALPASASDLEAARPLRVAIIGRINVGKSSLINRLCGHDRLIVSSAPGTTRDSTDTLVVRNRKLFALVDTAGIRRLSRTRDEREKASIIRAKRDIARADVLCLIMDAQEFPTRQDIAIGHLALESGKPLLLALNKWDLVERKELFPSLRARLAARLPFLSYASVLFVSALTGKRVAKILDLAEELHKCSAQRVETSRLNDFLAWVNQTHPPLSRSKRRVKIKYMTQKGVRPPTFVLFVGKPVSLSPAYEKFFIQLLREKFGFWGTPLRLILRRS